MAVDVVVLIVCVDVEELVAIIEYPVIVLPLLEGAVHDTVAVVLLAVTAPDTLVGVPGVVYGVMELDENE